MFTEHLLFARHYAKSQEFNSEQVWFIELVLPWGSFQSKRWDIQAVKVWGGKQHISQTINHCTAGTVSPPYPRSTLSHTKQMHCDHVKYILFSERLWNAFSMKCISYSYQKTTPPRNEPLYTHSIKSFTQASWKHFALFPNCCRSPLSGKFPGGSNANTSHQRSLLDVCFLLKTLFGFFKQGHLIAKVWFWKPLKWLLRFLFHSLLCVVLIVF